MSSTAVLVLGMHRSGTSLLMRMCNLLGVELGNELIPPAADNARGFFEHKEIVAINEEIFRCFDLSSQDVIDLPLQWREHPKVQPLAEKLATCLQRAFADTPLWGVKDPRIAKLLPLWLPLVETLPAEPVIFIPFRHPWEVAASLHKRDALSIERGMLLWVQYNLAIEYYTRGYNRYFIRYQDVIDDADTVIHRIAGILATPISEAVLNAVQRTIDPSLRHHLATPQEDHLPRLIDTLYHHMIALSQGAAEDNRVWDEVRQTMEFFTLPLQESIVGMKPDLYIWRNTPEAQAQEKEYFKARTAELEAELEKRSAKKRWFW